MKMFIKSSTIALIWFAGFAAHAEPAQKLVSIATSPEAQTWIMATKLTFQAVQQGAESHFGRARGPTGDMALKNTPDSLQALQALKKHKGMSSQEPMSMILDKTSAAAEACTIYLPNAELQADGLIQAHLTN